MRNASIIAQLVKEAGGYREAAHWTYGHVENDPHWQYIDMHFGRGEGLCMDSSHVYVIFDNNCQPRAQKPSDYRPLLLVLKRPPRD